MILMETFLSILNWAVHSPSRLVRNPPIPLFLCFLICLLAGCVPFGCARLPDEQEVPALSGGIQVDEPDQEVWIDSLLASGLDAVQVTSYARQQAWNSPDLEFSTNADGLVREIRLAKAAGLGVTLVLRVALEQGLVLNRHHWHGMIWPDDEDIEEWFQNYRKFALWGAELANSENVDLLTIGSELNSVTSTIAVKAIPDLYAYFLDTERTAAVRELLADCADALPPDALAPDLRFVDGGSYATFDAYLRAQETSDRAWTQHITGASRSEDVDIELLNARRATYERYWREIIGDIRRIYDGPLGYAANFDQIQEVAFWDALDVIGANAYFPLSVRGLAGLQLEEALTSSWLRVASMLNELANREGGPGRVLPVMFFELGWTRKAGSTIRPFSYHRVEVLETMPPGGPDGAPTLTCVHWATAHEDPFERVRALEALDRVVAQGAFPTLRGFTLWKLTTDPSHRGLEPFAVVIPSPKGSGSGVGGADTADRAYLESAARLAERLRGSARTVR